MSHPKRPHKARVRHPVTGVQFKVSAQTKPQLAYLVGHVDTMRQKLRVGATTPENVDRELRRIQHGVVTVEIAARSYMQSGVASATVRKCEAFLHGVGAPLAQVELYALDGPRCEAWVSSHAMRRKSPGSVKTYWRVLRAIVLHATVRGWIASLPWGLYKPRIRAAGYARGRIARESARDVGELLALMQGAARLDARRAAAGLLPDLQPKCAAVALLGIRQGELASLRWDDVDDVAGVVRVRSTKQGGPPVELQADAWLFERLAALRAELQVRQLYAAVGPVFPQASTSTPGHPRPYEGRAQCLPAELLQAAAREARLPHPDRWSPTSLRDTFATLESAGHAGDLEQTRQRTRHASIASLVRYLRSLSRGPAAPGFTLPAAPHRPELPPASGPRLAK